MVCEGNAQRVGTWGVHMAHFQSHVVLTLEPKSRSSCKKAGPCRLRPPWCFSLDQECAFWSESPDCSHFVCLGSHHRVVSVPDLDSFWVKLSWKTCSKSSPNRLWPLMGVQFMGEDCKLFWNNPFSSPVPFTPPLKVSQTSDPWQQLLHATELLLANTGAAIVFCFSSYVTHICWLIFFSCL